MDATHIVGGEIIYTILNADQNQYRISAQLFFDCENGDPGAIQGDDILIISQWDAVTGAYQGDFEINKTNATSVTENSSYNCVKNPGDVCVTSTQYFTTRAINTGTNGVILSWQRCCRNDKIDNIINPGSSGFTAWTKIPPKSIPNNSAYIPETPPIYVCIDAPLSIDQSAIDPDGDSLVYSFVTPFLGGADEPPERRRPNNLGDYESPPFRRVQWRPPYNIFNQLPGSPALNINSQTGEVTVTPTETGVFAIGILVQEYRNGVLVGETRRDYQITVINCVFDILANYRIEGGTAVGGIYNFECGDTINIVNTSIVKSGLSAKFFWDFGDLTATSDTLTTFDKNISVSYIYPGNGDYTITLKVTSSICNDDYKYGVRVRSTKSFELGPDIIFCEPFVQIIDTRVRDAISYSWNTGATSPSISTSQEGTYIVEVSYGKCSYIDTVALSSDPVPEFEILEDTLVCDTIDIVLDVGVTGLRYQWNTTPPQTSPSIRVENAGQYIVTVSNDNCVIKDTTRIWQPTKPTVEDAFYCGAFSHFVDVGDIEEATYLWSNGANSSSTTFTDGGLKWVRVNQRHCPNSDSFTITNPIIELELGPDIHFCDVLDTTLDAGPSGIKYMWNTGETTRTLNVTTPGRYSVEVENAEGCTSSDSIELTLSQSPEIYLGEDTTICVNSPTTFGVNTPYSVYTWNTGETTQYITTQSEGQYVLEVTDDLGCKGKDSLFITLDPEALPSVLYVPNAFTPNGDNLNELFPYKDEVIQPGYYIAIYSRWGEKIFDSRESDTSIWDAYYQGEKVPPSTLIYFMYYRGCDGNARTAKGTVQVIY